MTSTNHLETIIKEAIASNFGKNFAKTFIVGIQACKAQVICIFDYQTYTFPFNYTVKDFQKMGEELNLTSIKDAWFDASFRGKLEMFFH